MYILLVIILIIASFTILFAVQNTGLVTVSLLSWEFESSIALILLIAFLLGVIVAMLFSIPYFYRHNRTIKTLSARKRQLENQQESEDDQ